MPIVGGDRTVTGFDVADGRLVYAATTPITLPELFAGERQLTAWASVRRRPRPVAPERFTATSADGTEVEAG